jgi:putative nucleotidyltransferase with HDIG domain
VAPPQHAHALYPTVNEARAILAEAAVLNPGPWVQHSRYVAEAARAIARKDLRLDPDRAYVLGLLHDVGRRVTPTDMRHVLEGYYHLRARGFDDCARICLTHSFPIQDVHAAAGKWDCTPDELAFVTDYLASVDYTPYDSLIQLCDALALPAGFCLIEKRLVDVALRHGFNDLTLAKWRAYLALKRDFDAATGASIYGLLPGVVETTFDLQPHFPLAAHGR